MVRIRYLKLGIAALTFLVLILPTLGAKEDACRPRCQGSSRSSSLHDFRYREGSTYKYNFHSVVDISLANAKGQKSKTEVRGVVLLTPQSQCNQMLRLQNVEIIGANSQRYSHIAGIQKPIQFHFENGRIGDHICAETDESHNSLNIKRAVTSLFQVDTAHDSEVDIFGECPTLGSVERKSNGDTLITKTRDLNDCAYRENIKEDFMVSSFNPESEFKSTPLLDGDYLSEQVMKNGILNRAVVHENYTYLAFNDEDDDENEDLGARISVLTKLEYTGMTGDRAVQSRATEPKSIMFDNPHPITSDKSNMDSILNALMEVMQDSDMVVTEHTARHFLNLVKTLRDSSKDDILTVYGQVKAGAGFSNRDKARKVFLDALFRCGTGNAIVVGVELLKNHELTPVEEKLVYLGFAFIKHATLSALEAASSLLDTHNLPREAYLGIGNLAGRYCREHSCRAEAVERLTQRLAGKLRYGKVHSREEENEIIFVLKALANIQHLNDNVISKVSAIVQDKVSPTRLRVAALETYLADACHDSIRTSALNVLKDIQEDSELRIKAYLVVAKCPNAQVATALKTLLNNEPSYQVGGFVVSHLRNLQASANPDRKTAQHFLTGISTNKKFPIDPRKYSFNGEFSYDAENLGISNSIESNVIYSQNSFLPRSTSLNLTAELFGHTINFLEVGLRQQNLDRLVEHYFGPLGVFNRATPDEVAKTGEDTLDKIVDHFGQRLGRIRSKRDVSKAEIDNFGRQVHIETNELNNELDIDLSVKLFGSELFFLSISDDTEDLSPEDIIDRFFDNYERELGKGRNFDENIQTNSLFIDSQFSYPTSLGLPLRLAIEGTSSVQVKAKGNLDVPRLMGDNSNAGIFKLSLVPSANIEIATSVTLDAQIVEGGLKLISNLYTATGGDLEIDLQDRAKGMELKFSLPLQQQKLISATHEAVFNTRELGKSEQLQPVKFGQNKDFNICINDLSPYIGLNYCMDLNAPVIENGYFAGNYKFALGIDNEDFSHFHYKDEYNNPHKGIGGELTAEIIGNRQNKKMSVKLEAFYARESAYVKASLVSPIKTASIEARATNTDAEKSLSYEVLLDNQRGTGKLGLRVTGPSQRQRFTPLLEYTVPGAHAHQRLPINAQGAFVLERKGRGDFKVIFENLQLMLEQDRQRPLVVSVNGNMGREVNNYFSDLNLSDGVATYGINGKVYLQRNIVKLDGQFTHSHASDLNLHIIYEFKRHPTEIDSNLQLIHGRDANSQQNRLTLSDTLIYKRINEYEYEVKTKNKISYPLIQLDAVVDMAQTPNSVFYDMEVKYGKYIVGSEMDLKYSVQAEGDYDLDFELYDADDEIKLQAKREIHGEKNNIHNTLSINNAKYELSGTFTLRDKPNDINYFGDFTLSAPQLREPLRIHEELVNNHNQKNAVLKITDSREEYVDFSLSVTGDNYNTKLKVALRDTVIINGHATESRGDGKGEITIDLVPQRVKTKMEAAYTMHDPTYNLRVTIHPNLYSGGGSYLTLTTNNQIQEDSLNSKNTIDLSGQKLQLNAAYSNEDDDSNGKLHAEVDVSTPEGNYGAAKYNYNYDYNEDGSFNSQQSFDVEARGFFKLRNARFSLKEILKDVNLNDDIYDYTYTMMADDGEGRKLNVEALDKCKEEGEQIHEEIGIKVYKNHESDGLVVLGKAIIEDHAEDYDLSITYDRRQYLLNLHGGYAVGVENPWMMQCSVALGTPNPALQDVKFKFMGSLGDTPDKKLELKVNTELVANPQSRHSAIDFSIESNTKMGSLEAKTTVVIKNMPGHPITITIDGHTDETEEIQKHTVNMAVHYAQDKNIKSDLMVEIINTKQYNIKFNLEAPQTPPTRLELTAKELKPGTEYSGHAVLILSNKRYEITELIDLTETKPSFTLEVKYPNGQVDEIHFKADVSQPNQIEGAVKVKLHEYNIDLDGSLDAKFHSEDDFQIKVTANCPAIQINSFSLEVQNKPIGAPSNLVARRPNQRQQRYPRDQANGYRSQAQMYGEQLSINAQHAGRNLLSGSASYKVHEQSDKMTIDGSGTFTIRDERPKHHSYQIVRQKVFAGRDSSEGIEYTLNIKSDSDIVDAKLKYTDTEFGFLTTMCEKRPRTAIPCLRAEVASKLHLPSIHDFEIVETAHLDLRYLGWHEIGIKEVVKNHGNVFDSSGEIFFENKNKYQYKMYSDERTSEWSLTTPQRVVSLESKVQNPWGDRRGPTNVQVDFYMNKNHQPQQKTSLVGVFDCSYGLDGRCNIELKLSDPGLRKDLAITWMSNYNKADISGEQNLVFDIFSDANGKIVLTGKYSAKKFSRDGFLANLLYEVKSQGLDVDIKYEENLSFEPSYAHELKYNHLLNIHIGRATYNNLITLHVIPQQVLLVTKLLNRGVLYIDCKYHGDNYNRAVDTTVRMIGLPPTVTHLKITNNRSVKLTIAPVDRSDSMLQLTSNLFMGGVTDIKAEFYDRGRPQHLLTMSVRMDNRDDLVYDYVYDEHNIEKYIILPAKHEYAQVKHELEVLEKSAERDLANQAHIFNEVAKWRLTDARPVAQYYKGELDKFDQELRSDRALQDVLQVVNAFLEPFNKLIINLLISIYDNYEIFMKNVNRQCYELYKDFEHDIQPFLKEKLKVLSHEAKVTWGQAQEIISNIIIELNQFVGRHKKELKEFGVLVVEALEDIIVFAINVGQEIEKEITEELQKLYEQIKSTAVFEELDMRLKQALKGQPVPESYIRNFREIMTNMRDSTESPEIKKLIMLLTDYIEQKLRQQPVDDATAIQNILAALYEVLAIIYNNYASNLDEDVSISLNVLHAIPKLIAIELSPITYLLQGDWPDLEELFDSASLDFEDWSLPEDLDAVIAQGQHIFTFDGKHMTFPGTCSYMLAHDAINGNFSIVGSYSNGLLTAITFADKHDAVTIRKGGHVLLNQAPTDLPVRRRHSLEVIQDYASIQIVSKAGVEIICGPELMVCGVHISGYYHAQLRGLLGNGNNEPYDDFTLPSGTIVTNEGEFGNSYGIGRCPSVRTVDHSVKRRNPVCSRMFSSSSSLSLCYNFVDPENYRTACDHGQAAGIKGTDHAIAIAYVAICATKGISLEVPDNFVKCTNYEKPVRVGEEFQVTTPGRAADIVIVVDQDKANENVFKELLQPLIPQVNSALGREGISDIDFHIIGYGGAYERHPYHYAVGGKLAFKANRIPNVQFSKPLKESKRETFMEFIERIGEEVDLLTGQDMLSDAYYEALSYPYRAHAVKSIIVLNSKPCEEARLEQLQTWSSLLLVDEQYTVNLFTPFKGINPRDQQTSNVVGFNHDSVFTFSNPAGSKEGHQIESDNVCVEFALKNRGNVFVTNNFSQGRDKKRFVEIAAQSIAKELTSMKQWLDCKCEMVTAYTAQNTCEVSYSRRSSSEQQKGRGRY